MGTVSASLRLFDQFSSTLASASQAMHSTLVVAERLQQTLGSRTAVDLDTAGAVNRMEQMEQRIDKAFGNLQRTTSRLLVTVRRIQLPSNSGGQQLQDALQRIVQLEQKVVDLQDELNKKMKQSKGHADGLIGSLKGMVTAYLSIEAAKKLGEATIGAAMEQQQFKDTFSARSGSEALGGAIYDKITQQALKANQNVNDALTGSMSFMSNTMDPAKLMQLNSLAMRLSKLNPEEGLKGAAFSIKELMSGDYTSISERFNMSRSMLEKSAARKAGQSGDVDGFIKGLDDILNKQNMTQQAFDKMLDSPAAKWQGLINATSFSMAKAGQTAMQTLAPLFDKLGSLFASGKFEPFFTGLQVGLNVVAQILLGVVNAAIWFSDTVQQNWPIIESILAGMAVAILSVLVPALWAQIPPLYAALVAWLAMNWPILLVALAVATLVYVLITCGVTAEQVVGVISGTFMALFGYLYNQIALLYNTIATLAEFLVNVFIDPSYAVKKLFYDLMQTFGGYAYNMSRSAEEFAGNFMHVVLEAVNEVISGIDWLIDLLNQIPGFDIGKIGKYDTTNIHAQSDRLKEIMDSVKEPLKTEGVISIPRMDLKNLKNEFDFGYKKGAEVLNEATKMFKLPKQEEKKEGWEEALKNINRVNEVGSIKDKVDISSEDLKIMHNLAEMKTIQNFVTLTPTVQVTTGDINTPTDYEEMMRRIKDTMQQEITNTAQGVYDLG